MKRAAFWVMCVGVCGLLGCSRDLNVAEVKGRVTVEGKPVSGAMITFAPKAQGRSSFARTDGEGCYKLVYLSDANGALIGEHDVTINNESRRGEPPPALPIPIKYSSRGQLTATVTPGANEINFELKSK